MHVQSIYQIPSASNDPMRVLAFRFFADLTRSPIWQNRHSCMHRGPQGRTCKGAANADTAHLVQVQVAVQLQAHAGHAVVVLVAVVMPRMRMPVVAVPLMRVRMAVLVAVRSRRLFCMLVLLAVLLPVMVVVVVMAVCMRRLLLTHHLGIGTHLCAVSCMRHYKHFSHGPCLVQSYTMTCNSAAWVQGGCRNEEWPSMCVNKR